MSHSTNEHDIPHKIVTKDVKQKIGQNTEKSPGDLRKLAFTQSPAYAGEKKGEEKY